MMQLCRDCVKRGWWCLVRKGRVEGACLACQANKRRCSNSAIREKARTVKTEEREVTLWPVQVVRPPSKVKSAEYIEDSDGPNMEGEQREPAPKRQPARRARRQNTAPTQSMVSDGEPPAAGPSTEPGADKGILTVCDTYRVAAAAISHYNTRIQNVEAAVTQCREKHESMREALARSEEREREARAREVELWQIVEKLSTTVAGLSASVEGLSGTVQSLTIRCQRLKSSRNLLLKRVSVLEGSREVDVGVGEADLQSSVETGSMDLEATAGASDMSMSPDPPSPAARHAPLPSNEAPAFPTPAAAIPPPASADSSTPTHTEEPASHPVPPSPHPPL
ncbi:hypothetical protein LshimejAT787_2700150 [Lyophyllum shimeji]|uniref:Uncharacterized protein n=1 Tax=Lyophyllum shimeji TaxID=47721 RepID=A0A9P3UVC5_LYOSH|nr:hypothetical protein LshimejAT787_2700150 [Lyophyllum shimeji]